MVYIFSQKQVPVSPQDRISTATFWGISLFVLTGLDQSNTFSQIMNLSCLTMSDHYITIFFFYKFMTMYQDHSLWHGLLCRVKNILAMYLKYHKAGLTPTTPVTSTAISLVKMSMGHKSPTDLHSEMIFLQGKPVFYTIYIPITNR